MYQRQCGYISPVVTWSVLLLLLCTDRSHLEQQQYTQNPVHLHEFITSYCARVHNLRSTDIRDFHQSEPLRQTLQDAPVTPPSIPECPENDYGVVLEAGQENSVPCIVTVSAARCDPNTTLSFTLLPVDGTAGGGGKELQYWVDEDDGVVVVEVMEEEVGEYILLCNNHFNQSTPTGKHIYVGYRPLDVEEWQCLSYNWEVLECHWLLPYNPAQGDNEPYKSYLRTHNNNTSCRCEGRKCTYQSASCSMFCCAWPAETYYSNQERTMFMDFMVSNALGGPQKYHYPHLIHHWSVVLPDPAEDVALELVEGRTVEVRWKTPAALRHFPPCLTYLLQYRLSSQDSPWTLGGEGTCCSEECVRKVEVEYWWSNYQIRVRLRSSVASDYEQWWSSWSPINFTTPSIAPMSGPTLGPGSYQVSEAEVPEQRHLTLSWQPLQPRLHNGPLFTYTATTTQLHQVESVAADLVTNTFATFYNLSSTVTYRVEVASKNSEGVSDPSVVLVGASPSLPITPFLPVVITHTPQPNQHVYELRWSQEHEEQSAVNYTVYLCTDNQETPQPCQGQLYWLPVGNVTAVNVTLADLQGSGEASGQLRFAVSGEGETGMSSGLAWDTCSIPRPYTTNRRPPTPSKPIVEEGIVRVPWTAECQDWAGVLEGVQATYCQGHHNTTLDCHGDVDKVDCEVWSGEVKLVGMSAGVEYTVWLRLLYRAGSSLHSTPTTLITTNTHQVSWQMVTAVVVVSVLVVAVLTLTLFISVRVVRAFRGQLTRPIILPEGLQK
ncbi:hypothetical protein Pcinc_021363 [Petrolisthes cinctipes]|uniref:Fibronectin type-III domain-containing protein n=1 Tax=Petrolisthes cinctipes TaxID=88211 RepID=A0AAE1KHP0_PETCI|nr:hypothetical protein Pcinc_021363 [Petrolisthes cinctipes]